MDTFEVWWEKNCRLDKNSSREIWQASRENQNEYRICEFCANVGCRFCKKGKCCINDFRTYSRWKEKSVTPHCPHTAKEFHHWLKENGYRIVRITSGSG